jgi:O-antigen/teichoic acid export membrane protein
VLPAPTGSPAVVGFRSLLSGGTARRIVPTLLSRGGSAVAMLGMDVLVARLLGAAEAGAFFLLAAVLMFLFRVALVGGYQSIVRICGPRWAAGELGTVRAVPLQFLSLVAVSSVVLGGAGWFARGVMAERFAMPTLEPIFAWLAVLVFLAAALRCASAALTACRLTGWAQFVELGGTPLFGGLLMVAVHARVGLTLSAAVLCYAAGMTLALVLGTSRIAARLGWGPLAPLPWRDLLRPALNLMAIPVLMYLITWSGTFVLGVFSGPEEIAYFSAAARTALIVSFFLQVVNGVTMPEFATHHARGDRDRIERLAVRSALILTAAVAPVTVLFLLFPDRVMSLYGPEFAGAGALLRILALGQFVNVVTGSVGVILLMTGRESSQRNVLLLAAMLSVTLNLTLVPTFGATGAAVATAVVVAGQNLLLAWMVFRHLGIRTVPGWR